jgi:hypothetical protein
MRLCLVLLWLAGLPCLTVGCRIPNGIARSGSNPQYERASIVYELDGSRRPLPLTDSEIKPASFTAGAEATSEAPEWAGATLTLQYPHPDGIADTARATLRLTAEPIHNSRSAFAQASRWLGWSHSDDQTSVTIDGDSKSPSRDDEIWVLDIPKQQLDLLLTDLQQSGFFQAQTRTQSGTKLDVQLNWGRVQKEWSSEPRLDHFMSRVYREGSLGGLVARDSRPDHQNVYAER